MAYGVVGLASNAPSNTVRRMAYGVVGLASNAPSKTVRRAAYGVVGLASYTPRATPYVLRRCSEIEPLASKRSPYGGHDRAVQTIRRILTPPAVRDLERTTNR